MASGSGGDLPGRCGYNFDGRYNIKVNDQRFRPVQPSQELTFPLQEGNEYFGQASLEFQSIQETDGAPTLHQGISHHLPAVNSYIASSNLSSQKTTDVTTGPQAAINPLTRPYGSELIEHDDLRILNGGNSLSYMLDTGPQAAINPSTRPYGSVLVAQDDLPLYSNGGDSLPPMMAIQELPPDSWTYPPTQPGCLLLPERKKSDSDVSMNSDEERSSPVMVSDVRNMKAREESFKTAPDIFNIIAQLKPKLLAEHGLYYTGKGDEVQCFSCGTGICNWELDDDHLIEHIKHGPPEICSHLRTIVDIETLLEIKATLTAGQTILSVSMEETSTAKKLMDDTTCKEPGDRSMSSMSSGHFRGATQVILAKPFDEHTEESLIRQLLQEQSDLGLFCLSMRPYRSIQGSVKTFICFDCGMNTVNHTQLRCGHGICDMCIKNSIIPEKDRVCSACNQPVTGYVPFSPGCF